MRGLKGHHASLRDLTQPAILGNIWGTWRLPAAVQRQPRMHAHGAGAVVEKKRKNVAGIAGSDGESDRVIGNSVLLSLNPAWGVTR